MMGLKKWFLWLGVFLFFDTTSSFANDPAFACVGRLESNDGSERVEINQNVIFNLVGGYIQETLALIPNFYDVTINATDDGTSQILVQMMITGWPETMASYEVGAGDSRIFFYHRDWWVELGLRCARIGN